MTNSKYIVIGVIGLVIIGLIVVLVFGGKEPQPSKAELEFWGVYDDSDVYRDLIRAFKQKYPSIRIEYRKKSYETYEKELIDALASGRGPDIFMIHNSWLPKHIDKIAPLTPKEIQTFKETFVDTVSYDFLRGGKIYGIPLFVDTLALYWNKDLFNKAAIPLPPQTWEEFLEDVEKLTQFDEKGNIEIAGAALGTVKNINRSTDILTLLMLQGGTQMTNEKYTKATFDQRVRLEKETFYPGVRALEFYTDFANSQKRVYAWNKALPYSIDAFSQKKVAMMLNYSHHLETIKKMAPYLNFAVSSLPQPEQVSIPVNYASYWALTVSSLSSHPQQSWTFITWLNELENAKNYLLKTKKPTSQRTLIDWQKANPDLKIFAEQSLSAKNWYQADNVAIENIFADMIESVVDGEISPIDAIKKAADQVTLLMR